MVRMISRLTDSFFSALLHLKFQSQTELLMTKHSISDL